MTAAPALIAVTRAELDHAHEELSALRAEVVELRRSRNDDGRRIVALLRENETLVAERDRIREEFRVLCARTLEDAAIRREMRPGESFLSAKARCERRWAALDAAAAGEVES